MKQCSKCNELKELDEFNINRNAKDGHYAWCRNCSNEADTKRHRADGQLPMSENKECSSYLGVAVAERLISHMFKDVTKMPYGNIGFDFICNRDKKIDVKSACITRRPNNKNPYWGFTINHNKIADYFLLIAFNNRADLELQYQWLIPGYVLNQQKNTSISPTTIDRWDEYKQPIGPALACCNIIKSI